MNKFSAMSGQKVNDVPELITNKDTVKLEALKAGINSLIDNFLTIRSYGSARKNILESTVKISGKEVFIEALIDFMNDKSIEDQMKTLESLKGETRDWQVIDNKINELNKLVEENKEFNSNRKQINKVKTLLDTYGDDDRFETILENMVSKSNDSNEANLMSITANKMKSNFKFLNYSRKQLSSISEKYGKKAQELSFKENGFPSR
jgi:hypothetical protein